MVREVSISGKMNGHPMSTRARHYEASDPRPAGIIGVKARARTLLAQGMTDEAVAESLNVTADYIAKLRRKDGMLLWNRPRVVTEDEKQTIKSLAMQGKKDEAIARKIGKRPSYVREVRYSMGIKLTSQGKLTSPATS